MLSVQHYAPIWKETEFEYLGASSFLLQAGWMDGWMDITTDGPGTHEGDTINYCNFSVTLHNVI